MTHPDDWFGPDVDTGILGHGHDGLVIDRIKHSRAATCTPEQVAIIAAATCAALSQQAPVNAVAGWVEKHTPPEVLWQERP